MIGPILAVLVALFWVSFFLLWDEANQQEMKRYKRLCKSQT